MWIDTSSLALRAFKRLQPVFLRWNWVKGSHEDDQELTPSVKKQWFCQRSCQIERFYKGVMLCSHCADPLSQRRRWLGGGGGAEVEVDVSCVRRVHFKYVYHWQQQSRQIILIFKLTFQPPSFLAVSFQCFGLLHHPPPVIASLMHVTTLVPPILERSLSKTPWSAPTCRRRNRR